MSPLDFEPVAFANKKWYLQSFLINDKSNVYKIFNPKIEVREIKRQLNHLLINLFYFNIIILFYFINIEY